MTDEPRRFSHSLISTYLDCPKKAYFRYVEEVPSPRSGTLVRGSACDEAWNYALELKVEGKEPPALDELLEVTEDAFRGDVHVQGGVDSIDWAGDDAKAIARQTLDSALALTKTWHSTLLPAIEPTAVQVRLERRLESGRLFLGSLDYDGQIEGREGIGDNKTGGRSMGQDSADKDLQPYAYSFLRNAPTDFAFTRAIDTGRGTQKGEIVWTSREKRDIDAYLEIVTEVEKGWEAEVFPANPASNLCSQKWCSFWDICPAGRSHRTTHLTVDSRTGPGVAWPGKARPG